MSERKKRVFSKESTKNVIANKVAEEEGWTRENKKPWTVEENTEAIRWVHDEGPLRGKKNGLTVRTGGRSEMAGISQIWKIAVGYTEANKRKKPRVDLGLEREELPFAATDYYLIHLAYSKAGCRDNSDNPNHVAALLGRTVKSVEKEIERLLKGRRKGFLELEATSEKIYKIASDLAKKVIEKFELYDKEIEK